MDNSILKALSDIYRDPYAIIEEQRQHIAELETENANLVEAKDHFRQRWLTYLRRASACEQQLTEARQLLALWLHPEC